MKKKILIILITSLTLIGCSNSKEKEINLRNFLPSIKDGSTYKYELKTIDNGKSDYIFNKEKKISSLKNNCVSIDEYMIFKENTIKNLPEKIKKKIKNNKILTGTISLCFDNKKIYSSSGDIIYQKNKDWLKTITFGNKTVNSICSLIDIKEEIIFGDKRTRLHTECKYDLNTDDFKKGKIETFIAEDIGIYKSIFSIDEISITTKLIEIN